MSEIRKLETSDWQILKDIRLRALKESPHAFIETYEKSIKCDQSFWERRASSSITSATFVAFEDNVPIGMVACFSERKICNLVAMWVSPEFRGTGVSADLVGRVIEFAKTNKFEKVFLKVTQINERASKFYQKLGFQTQNRKSVTETSPTKDEKGMFKNIT